MGVPNTSSSPHGNEQAIFMNSECADGNRKKWTGDVSNKEGISMDTQKYVR